MWPETLVTVRKLTRKIAGNGKRLVRLREMLTKTNQELDGMPHAQQTTSSIDRFTCEIFHEEKKIEKMKEIRAICKLELEDLLFQFLKNHEREFETLTYYYCDNFSFNAISAMISCTVQTVYRYHKNGLKILGFSLEEVIAAEESLDW